MKQLLRERERLIVEFWGYLKVALSPELSVPFERVSAANRCLERLREELES